MEAAGFLGVFCSPALSYTKCIMTIDRKNIFSKSGKVRAFGLTLAMSASLLPYTRAFALDDNALPSGGTVTGGSATLDYSNPGHLDVHQGTDRAIIDWNSFNIGKNATTQFYQPSSSSMVVNKVTGSQDPTKILGTLKANGTVIVLDKNGVIFGKNSVIDVGGIVASTGSINENGFMNGDAQLQITGVNTGGKIINKGTVTVSDAGLAAFVAPTVINDGVIQAKMGRVALASGTAATIDLYGDGLVEVAADASLQDALISNNGIIRVSGGYVLLTAPAANAIVNSAINNDGVIDVSSATDEGGKIVLQGGNNINVNGTLDASGATGGGEILVGGDYQGGGTVAHAGNTTISDLALLRADTTGANGNGGKIVVWSDNQTKIAGKIEANAGSAGGNGGSIETSSKDKLNVTSTAKVSASAPNGKNGQWLLDPRNVILQNAVGTNASGGGTIDPTTNDEVVDISSVETALNNGLDVTITTGSTGAQDGDISVLSDINKTAGTDTTFTLQAARNVVVAADITSSVGKLNLVLNADHDVNHDGGVKMENANISTNGGYLVAGGGDGALGGGDGILGNGDGTGADDAYAYGSSGSNNSGVYLGNTTIDTNGGNVFFSGSTEQLDNGTKGVLISNGSKILTGAGNINIRGKNELASISYGGSSGTLLVDNSLIETTSGNIDITGTSANSSTTNRGLIIDSGQIHVSGDGDITLYGTGGSGSDSAGIRFNNASGIVADGAGDIQLHGTGGQGDTSDGIYMDSSYIEANGTGKISIEGSGNAADQYQSVNGLNIRNTSVSSASGDISLTGTGGGTGVGGSSHNNNGIYIYSSTLTQTGNGKVTLDGTSGVGYDSFGVFLDNSGVTNQNADIDITGAGGESDNNQAVVIGYSALEADGNGNIIVEGTGSALASVDATGIDAYHSTFTTAAGDIHFIGLGGGDGSNGYNHGILSYSNGFTVTDDGDILLEGTAGQGDNQYGLLSDGTNYLNANGNISLIGTGSGGSGVGVKTTNVNTITSSGIGDITVHGDGGDGDNAEGIYMEGSGIESNGTGDIILEGTGGATGEHNAAIWMENTNIASAHGDISLTGTSTSSDGDADGIKIKNYDTIISNGEGDITLHGTGGGGYDSTGVLIYDGVSIESNGTGDISITGISGATGAYDMNGILLHNSEVTSTSGDIALIGTGGGDGSDDRNRGVMIDGGSTIEATTSGDITLHGTGGKGDDSDGVYTDSSNIQSGTGDIAVTGIGGAGNYSAGIKIYGTDFTTGSTGKITMTGTTDTTFQNSMRGIEIGDWSGDLTTIQTDRGNIELTGTGGGDGTGSSNFGIYMRSTSTINVTDDGDIILNGTGGYGSDADGVNLDDHISITNVDGDISITGKDQHGSNHNDENGIVLNNHTTVSTSGAGNVALDGSVTYSDSGAEGLLVTDSNVTTSGAGNINITGTNAGADGTGMVITGTSAISSVKALVAKISSLFYDTNSSFSAGTDMTIKSNTASDNIGLGGGAGDLVLNDGFLGDIAVGRTLIIGDSAAGTGNIDIDSWDLSAQSYDVQVFGKNIDLGGLDMGSGDVWLYAKNGSIVNSADTDTNASGKLVLLAGDDVTVNEDLVNAGIGTISLFAGWNGTSALQIPSLVNPASIVLSTGAHDITLGMDGKVASAGTGTSVLFAASDKFVNNATAGAAAIDPGTGRFLIYSKREDTTVPNGIAGIDPAIYGKTYMNLSPLSVPGGSRFIYKFDPNAPVNPPGGGNGETSPVVSESNVSNQASNLKETSSGTDTSQNSKSSADCLTSDEETGKCVVE